MEVRLAAAFGSLFLACSACVTGKPSVDVRAAQMAVDQARQLGADKEFAASMHLAYAERQLWHAKALAKADDLEGAQRWALRSQSDAALASILAAEVNVRDAARRALEQAERIKAEVDRQPDPARTLRGDREEER
jgi:hypothetical protein